MPSRWVINPVIIDVGVRKPKVSIIADPGIPPVPQPEGGFVNKTYKHSSAISGEDWALSFVRGVDFSALDSDPDIITVLDGDDEDLSLTPSGKGWGAGRINSLKGLMASKGVSARGLNRNNHLWQWLGRMGQRHSPEFRTKGTWVK